MSAAGVDQARFAEQLEPHRRELHVHCYRMLASYDAAEDAVQDTFVRAWGARDSFGGVGNVRAWLYKIATNVCLDRVRQVKALDRSFSEVPWLTPYPDRLLDELLVARETIELAFLALIQLLPARQRAVLLLRDVLDYSAAETASALDMTVPSVTSALQRARATTTGSVGPGGSERAEQPAVSTRVADSPRALAETAGTGDDFDQSSASAADLVETAGRGACLTVSGGRIVADGPPREPNHRIGYIGTLSNQ
jgi:RNA polymerase sigma-70 factor (TIGR02960 family)